MPAPGQHVFSEKVALVTGAATPIGRAVSLQLGLYGSYVIACRNWSAEDSSDSIDELKKLGTLASSIEADLSNAEGARDAIDEVEAAFGRLDILVNCLISEDHPQFSSLSENDLEIAFGKTLKQAILLSRESLRLLVERPKPRIVNVIAPSGYAQDGTGIVEAALGAGIESLTSGLAVHLPSKFRINAVSVQDRAPDRSGQEELDAELFRPPSGVDPDDVARVVIFLLSPEAKSLNGQVLRIG